MNELQKKEFEILVCFMEICEQLELTYYLVCGSALGAVKYLGFIPWDDDLDLALPRTDYEIFVKRAQEFLPNHYFLQNYRSEPNFPQCYSKLRNSETTFIEKTVSKIEMNHGIYIDIFPLDGYPENRLERVYFEIKKKWYKRLLACNYLSDGGFVRNMLNTILKTFGVHKRSAVVVEKFEQMISKYPIDSSRLICNHGNWQGTLEYAPREQYGEGTWATFEGLRVRVPEKYDEYLTQKYGDWRADLPENKKRGHHYYEVIDLDKPYTEYV